MKETDLVPTASLNLSQEFCGAELGDPRLERRLLSIAAGLEAKPAESFPVIFPEQANLEAFYRFLRNPLVDFRKILEPHYQRSCARSLQSEEVLLLHDTSDLQFHRKKETDLGLLNGSRKGSVKQVGFPAHFSIAISGFTNPEPLGLIQLTPLRRLKLSKTPRRHVFRHAKDAQKLESSKWINNIKECRRRLGQSTNSINVMDREADCYALMGSLVGSGERFVIRVAQVTRLVQIEEEKISVAQVLSARPVVCEREVHLSERRIARGERGKKRHPPRLTRQANLSITATSVEVVRPTDASAKDYPKTIKLNIVHVFEANPPEGEKPVDWKLYTTESIENEAKILRIIDIYRARWVIEEFFKALKTGCSYENRQVESFKTAMNALALLLPMAWQMLLLRHYSRQTEFTTPTSPILNPIQLAIITSLSNGKLNEQATPRELLYAVAALGGHIKNNGDPGWLVLYRGIRELHSIERGVALALGAPSHVINQ